MKPVHIFTHYFFKLDFNIIFPYMQRVPVSGFPIKILREFLIVYFVTAYFTCILFDHPNNIRLWVRIIKRTVMQF